VRIWQENDTLAGPRAKMHGSTDRYRSPPRRACNATRNTHQQGHALARTVACLSIEAHTRFSRLLRVRTVAFVRRASPTSTHTRTNTVHTLAREREGRRCGCVSHAALLVFSS